MLRTEGGHHVDPPGKQRVDEVDRRAVVPCQNGGVVAHDPHTLALDLGQVGLHPGVSGNDLRQGVEKQGGDEQKEGDN